MQEDGMTYRSRDTILRGMGFSSYGEYLESILWKFIRMRVLGRGRAVKTCSLCTRKATVVHHLDYSESTLNGMVLDSLTPLCKSCHHKIEFQKDGRKRSLSAANAEYRNHLANRKRRDLPPNSETLQPTRVKITDALLEKGRSRNGGWSNKQLQCFGIQGFPEGWKSALVGREVEEEAVIRFLYLQNQHLAPPTLLHDKRTARHLKKKAARRLKKIKLHTAETGTPQQHASMKLCVCCGRKAKKKLLYCRLCLKKLRDTSL